MQFNLCAIFGFGTHFINLIWWLSDICYSLREKNEIFANASDQLGKIDFSKVNIVKIDREIEEIFLPLVQKEKVKGISDLDKQKWQAIYDYFRERPLHYSNNIQEIITKYPHLE